MALRGSAGVHTAEAGRGTRSRRGAWGRGSAHYGTARDVLNKARRDKARYEEALARGARDDAADHQFNLAVTILVVRDWIEKTSPAYADEAAEFVKREPAIARMFDSGNIGKYHVLKSKSRLADGTRVFHQDDAAAAIAAWDRFLTERGL